MQNQLTTARPTVPFRGPPSQYTATVDTSQQPGAVILRIALTSGTYRSALLGPAIQGAEPGCRARVQSQGAELGCRARVQGQGAEPN